MTTQYTLDQVREAKEVLERELNEVISKRLRIFAELTGYRVEAISTEFITVQKLGSKYQVPIFQRAKVKLEDI